MPAKKFSKRLPTPMLKEAVARQKKIWPKQKKLTPLLEFKVNARKRNALEAILSEPFSFKHPKIIRKWNTYHVEIYSSLNLLVLLKEFDLPKEAVQKAEQIIKARLGVKETERYIERLERTLPYFKERMRKATVSKNNALEEKIRRQCNSIAITINILHEHLVAIEPRKL